MLCVAEVRLDEAKVTVYVVPAVPLMPRLLNVATPLDALTDAVPTVLPPVLTEAVTAADELVTVLPAESSTRTTGCVVNAAPDEVP
jgi:hypothetical protein